MEEQSWRRMVEKELVHWKPTRENDAVPAVAARCVVHDLTGIWVCGGDMASTNMKLFAMAPGRYRVLFTTGGCVGHWSLTRTATYRDGILRLDRPVKEYVPWSYDRLFTIRTPQGIRLISDAALVSCQQEVGKGKQVVWNEFRVSYYTFTDTTRKRTVAPTLLPTGPPRQRFRPRSHRYPAFLY